MISIGQYNFLKIERKTGRGTFLAAGRLGELFLPKGQTPEYCEAGDKIEVFVYRNSLFIIPIRHIYPLCLLPLKASKVLVKALN